MNKKPNQLLLNNSTMTKAKVCIANQKEEARLAFTGEWTRAVTDDRLRDWNNACISHRFGVRTTQWSHIRDYEKEVGYTYDNLLSAVLLHYSQEYGDAAWILPTNAAMTQVQRPNLGSKRIYMGLPIGTNRTEGLRSRVCPSGPHKHGR